MERFGFEGVNAFDIVKTGVKVREELAETDPEKAAGLYVYFDFFSGVLEIVLCVSQTFPVGLFHFLFTTIN